MKKFRLLSAFLTVVMVFGLLAAAMPVLILCSVIVCPVFVDLSQFIPVFKVLEKAFPIAYYLG